MPLFDRDRYQRLDTGGGGGGARRPSSPSSFCSTTTIVVFVALCLVAAWMMASSNSVVPISVSPDNKSAAKQDISVDFRDDIDGGRDDSAGAGDVLKTTEEAKDIGKKDDDAGGTPQTRDNAVGTDKKDDGAGDTPQKTEDSGKKDDDAAGDTPPWTEDAGDTGRKDDDANLGGVAETTDAESNSTAGDTAVDKSQTFSDENGKTEGGEVMKPEDPDKKAEKNAEEAATGGQSDNDAKEASKDTGDQVDKSTDEAPAETKETGGQDEKNADEAGSGAPKNTTAFDGRNSNLDGGEPVKEDGDVAENNPKEAASDGQDSDTARATGDDTTTGVQNDAAKNNDSTNEEKKPEAGGDGDGGAAEKAELLPSGQADLLNETAAAVAQNGSFPTQAAESNEEKAARARSSSKDNGAGSETTTATPTEEAAYVWKLCNVSAGADYIPCLDNEAAIKKLRSTKHYEHRERHCPAAAPSCLVPLPEGYRRPIPWPHSRDKIWYHNVPHTKLASYKGHQNWVKVSGEHLAFPGGGTQFTHGAKHYIDVIQEALPAVAWGRRSRVVLDVGCGVASFGGYLFDGDALTMSLAPKDEHEAQVQFALERGIPAISAVMGTKRLPFPGAAFDVAHCARCRVPWHADGGRLLLEVNRLLRPGGLFIWSATPVYRKVPEDVEIWHAMAALTKSMCWEIVKKTSDTVDQTAMVIFQKPSSNDCYNKRQRPEPPLCDAADDPNAAWNITLQSCMHRVATDPDARGAQWPEQWPERLTKAPHWLSPSQTGVYGKPAPEDFAADSDHWAKAVGNSYLAGMGIDWQNVRNVMDMRAVYGGFAAALREKKVWVMNVVTVDSPDTLPIIYDRGLFGMYHDWCESFSTYPRSYDLLHADHLFSKLNNRCELTPVIAEVDRILRPEGKLIVRDSMETVEEVQRMVRSLQWEVGMTVSKHGEGLLCVTKTMWRPTEVEALS